VSYQILQDELPHTSRLPDNTLTEEGLNRVKKVECNEDKTEKKSKKNHEEDQKHET
jgi:hypothetical protein